MSLESNLQSHKKILALKDRAHCFQLARSFFYEKNILEVDTPLLSKAAPIDEHIDILSVQLGNGDLGYLHSSPEYAMKRLLSLGLGDIYQMSHVFRQGEISPKHNPEFTMVEWYRIEMSFSDFIQETLVFIQLFLGNLPHKILSYKEAFHRYADIDYTRASKEDLLAIAKAHKIELSTPKDWDKEDLLHLLMGCIVEPHLGQGELLVLCDYPAAQAALAQTEMKEGLLVAKRFEIYYQSVELANGYLELTDVDLQRSRLIESNYKRSLLNKDTFPLDEFFLSALAKGIPSCCGVAVGFDRLMLLRNKAKTLQEVLPFSWSEV